MSRFFKISFIIMVLLMIILPTIAQATSIDMNLTNNLNTITNNTNSANITNTSTNNERNQNLTNSSVQNTITPDARDILSI